MKENWLSQSTQDSNDSFYSLNQQEQCHCKKKLKEVEDRIENLDDKLLYNDCLIVEQAMGTAPSTGEEIDWEMGKDSQPDLKVEQGMGTGPLMEDEKDWEMEKDSQPDLIVEDSMDTGPLKVGVSIGPKPDRTGPEPEWTG